MSDRERRLAELNTVNRIWFHDRNENDTLGLIQLCRDWITSSCTLAEIGCFAGVSTEIFALFAGKVVAVDPWERAAERGYRDIPRDLLVQARERFHRMVAGYPHIQILDTFSLDAAATILDGSLDAVYIDGEHAESAFVNDVRAWRPKLQRGGLLMGHDYDQVGRYFAAAGLPEPTRTYVDTSFVVQLENGG